MRVPRHVKVLWKVKASTQEFSATLYRNRSRLLTYLKLADIVLAIDNRISVLHPIYVICGHVDTVVAKEIRGYINNLHRLSFR